MGQFDLVTVADVRAEGLTPSQASDARVQLAIEIAGVYVRNVAMTVIRRPYAVYSFDGAVGRRDRSLAALVDSRARSARPRGARDGRAAR